MLQEHLPYVLPIVFYTTMNNMNWSIGLEVTLVGAGLHRHQHADHRRDDLLGQPAHRDGRRHLVVDLLPVLFVVILFIGLFLLAISMNEYIDPRSRLARMGGMRE